MSRIEPLAGWLLTLPCCWLLTFRCCGKIGPEITEINNALCSARRPWDISSAGRSQRQCALDCTKVPRARFPAFFFVIWGPKLFAFLCIVFAISEKMEEISPHPPLDHTNPEMSLLTVRTVFLPRMKSNHSTSMLTVKENRNSNTA